MRSGRIDVDALLADVRQRLDTAAPSPSKAWAREVVARYRRGERVKKLSVQAAMEALGMPAEPIVLSPASGVQRPDGKDRQAGDVEVQW